MNKKRFLTVVVMLAVLWLAVYAWSEWDRLNKQVLASTPTIAPWLVDYASPTNWPPTAEYDIKATQIARIKELGFWMPPQYLIKDGVMYKNAACYCALGTMPASVGAMPCEEGVGAKIIVGNLATPDPTHVPQCAGTGYAYAFGEVQYERIELATATPTPTKTATSTPTQQPSITPTIDCLSQSWPVGDSMPAIPECDQYMKTVQWNAYVRPKATTYDGLIPLGLRYRNCPSLFCDGIGTAYAYCPYPALLNWKCSDEYLYLEEVAYRLPVSEFGWTDEGYWGKMNRWGWYPLCVKLPQKDMKCYTDWEPSLAIQTVVEEWVTGLK